MHRQYCLQEIQKNFFLSFSDICYAWCDKKTIKVHYCYRQNRQRFGSKYKKSPKSFIKLILEKKCWSKFRSMFQELNTGKWSKNILNSLKNVWKTFPKHFWYAESFWEKMLVIQISYMETVSQVILSLKVKFLSLESEVLSVKQKSS